MGNAEEDVLPVYHRFAFVVANGVSGRIPLCHKENGEAPK